MLYWVIYDITQNGIRSKVSSKCKDYGLRRVQKSAFLGDVSRNKIDMFSMEVKDIIGSTNNCVFIFPSCKECFSGKIIQGHLDEERIKKKDFLVIS
jgi:CRISPR-associated protein Cas2